MAVVSMQKVRLVVHATDVDEALQVVQRARALEFLELEDAEEIVSPDIVFPYTELLPRVQHAVKFLEPYAPEVGLWRTLREGSRTELTEKEVEKKLQSMDAVSLVVDDLEQLQVEFADKNEEVSVLTAQNELLRQWKELQIPLNRFETKYTRTLLAQNGAYAKEFSLKEVIEEKLNEESIPFELIEVSKDQVAIIVEKDNDVVAKVEEVIEAVDAELVDLPEGGETPDIEFMIVSEKLAAAKGEQALLHDQAEHFAITHYKDLCVAGEVLSWQQSRFSMIDNASATKYTVVFTGWLNSNRRAEIEQAFAKEKLAAFFTELEPEEGEEPPVDIENSALVRPFEAVTRLYGMPGHKDLDPTAFLAGFFFLFFGLSLTDVGYGLFLMIASLAILTLFKVADTIRLFAKLLLFVGFATVLVGMLFGGYFGIDSSQLPTFLQKLQMFDPIGDPLPVFYLALGLGVVQVMAGMIIKIYSEFKNGRLMNGVLNQGPWLFLFAVGIVYVGSLTSYVNFLSVEQIVHLAYVGVAMVVLSSGRKGKSIFGKIQSAAAGLYESIGYFSDILSYSRLLALGLATTALAFAVNLIAGMVIDVPFVGFVLAGLVLFIGHIFTLAVNTLGAFIHSARLQFVEFFGKFIAGTGREFDPLARTEKYVTVKKE